MAKTKNRQQYTHSCLCVTASPSQLFVSDNNTFIVVGMRQQHVVCVRQHHTHSCLCVVPIVGQLGVGSHNVRFAVVVSAQSNPRFAEKNFITFVKI